MTGAVLLHSFVSTDGNDNWQRRLVRPTYRTKRRRRQIQRAQRAAALLR
jgi:hypothetical protein